MVEIKGLKQVSDEAQRSTTRTPNVSPRLFLWAVWNQSSTFQFVSFFKSTTNITTTSNHFLYFFFGGGEGDAKTKLPSVRFLQQPQLILHSHGGGGGGDQ